MKVPNPEDWYLEKWESGYYAVYIRESLHEVAGYGSRMFAGAIRKKNEGRGWLFRGGLAKDYEGEAKNRKEAAERCVEIWMKSCSKTALASKWEDVSREGARITMEHRVDSGFVATVRIKGEKYCTSFSLNGESSFDDIHLVEKPEPDWRLNPEEWVSWQTLSGLSAMKATERLREMQESVDGKKLQLWAGEAIHAARAFSEKTKSRLEKIEHGEVCALGGAGKERQESEITTKLIRSWARGDASHTFEAIMEKWTLSENLNEVVAKRTRRL